MFCAAQIDQNEGAYVFYRKINILQLQKGNDWITETKRKKTRMYKKAAKILKTNRGSFDNIFNFLTRE